MSVFGHLTLDNAFDAYQSPAKPTRTTGELMFANVIFFTAGAIIFVVFLPVTGPALLVYLFYRVIRWHEKKEEQARQEVLRAVEQEAREAAAAQRAADGVARERAFVEALEAQSRSVAEFQALSPREQEERVRQRLAEHETRRRAAEEARWEEIKAEEAARRSRVLGHTE